MALCLSACSVVAGQSLDRVLAVVSGQVILASDVRAFLELGLFTIDTSDQAARESAALNLLIERRLALDEVERSGSVALPAARVEQEMAAVRARFTDEAAFTRLLAEVGLNLDDLRQIHSDDARLEAYLIDRFGPSTHFAEPRPAPVADWLASLARRAEIARFDQ